jgi:maleate isomerase
MISTLPDVTIHFSRFRVTQITLSPEGRAQFDHSIILQAAQLLADAHVDVIGWCGTAAGWLGFEDDESLCKAVTEATGIPATTSVLSLNKALRIFEVKRLGLVTPYTADIQQKIIENYAAIGVEITTNTERHHGVSDNESIAAITLDELASYAEEVVAGGVDAVSPFCTNLCTSTRAEEWEGKCGVPVLDTITTVVWDMLKIVGVDTTGLRGWGKLFQV